jgi:hypothetical protein
MCNRGISVVLLSGDKGVFDVAFIGSGLRRRHVPLSVYNTGSAAMTAFSSHPSVSAMT